MSLNQIHNGHSDKLVFSLIILKQYRETSIKKVEKFADCVSEEVQAADEVQLVLTNPLVRVASVIE